ncbi:HNH endonuclease [Roseibium sp. RKSG952]|nr:hypothetical protein [Roseibium sp. RKSG952]
MTQKCGKPPTQHQDAGYMQLVPTDLHSTVRHTGGVATGGQ